MKNPKKMVKAAIEKYCRDTLLPIAYAVCIDLDGRKVTAEEYNALVLEKLKGSNENA